MFLLLLSLISGTHFDNFPGSSARDFEQAVYTDRSAYLFEEATSDGSVVRGQVDMPISSPRAAVILVSGTGSFDRDVYLGSSGTARDLVFLDLSYGLRDEDVAVVRFDKRGVRFDEAKIAAYADMTVPTGWWLPKNFAHSQSKPEYATADSGVEDLVAVYEIVRARLPGIPVFLFAHSEGMLHVARAVEERSIRPDAIIGMGALMESPVSAFSWQRIDRIPEALTSLDGNGDCTVTNDEIREGFSRTPAAVFGAVDAFLAPDGAWSRENLAEMRQAWQAYYDREVADALAHPRGDLLIVGGKPIATYGWWQTWFTDEKPVAARMLGGPPLYLFYGSADSQTPSERQRAAVDAAGLEAKIEVFDDLGHTLGYDVFRGPIEPEPRARIIRLVSRLSSNAH